jgi:hypothetical protein
MLQQGFSPSLVVWVFRLVPSHTASNRAPQPHHSKPYRLADTAAPLLSCRSAVSRRCPPTTGTHPTRPTHTLTYAPSPASPPRRLFHPWALQPESRRATLTHTTRGAWTSECAVYRAGEDEPARKKPAKKAEAEAGDASSSSAAPTASPFAATAAAKPAASPFAKQPASPFAKPASPFASPPSPLANPVAGASKPAASPFAAGAKPPAKVSSPFQSGAAKSPFGTPSRSGGRVAAGAVAFGSSCSRLGLRDTLVGRVFSPPPLVLLYRPAEPRRTNVVDEPSSLLTPHAGAQAVALYPAPARRALSRFALRISPT